MEPAVHRRHLALPVESLRHINICAISHSKPISYGKNSESIPVPKKLSTDIFLEVGQIA
jgi:hypothetical protein